MSNMYPIPNKHFCSLYHQSLVSRWEYEHDDQSFFKVNVYLTSLCSGCWGHPRAVDGSSSVIQCTSPMSSISYDPAELTTHLIWPITTHDYHRCLITNNHDLCLLSLSSDHVLYLMSLMVTHHSQLWPITTHGSYLTWPIINNHELWPMTSGLIIHNSSHMSMTLITHDHVYHSWPSWLMTIIYDLSHLWLSLMTISITYDHCDHYDLWHTTYDTYHPWPSLMTMIHDYHLSHRLITHDNASHPWPITIHDYTFLHWPMTSLMTYDLWPMTYDLWLMNMTITYDLWPMTCDLWIWLSRMTYDYDLWSSPITSDYHLPLITITHVLSITMTYHIWALLMTIIYDYHIWVSHMTITCDYDLITHDYVHHLWTSLMDITYEHQVLCLMPYTLWFITCEYHTRLLPMTIIHDYVHHSWPCPSPMNMTITHEHDCHPWLWISLTTYHHSWLAHITHGRSHHPWLAHITRDYHLCVLPMTVTDALSLVLITSHPWPSSLMTITHDHHPRPSPMTMTTIYHSWLWLLTSDWHLCLLSYVCLSCLWLMTIMTMTMTYHLWLSHPTIIHDYDSWPSGLITWLLTHDFSPMAIKVFSPMTMTVIDGFPLIDHHPWGWHTPYDHDFSPMTTTTNDHKVSSTTIRTLTHDHQNGHRCPLWVSLVVSSHGLFDGWVWCPPWQTPPLRLTHPLW